MFFLKSFYEPRVLWMSVKIGHLDRDFIVAYYYHYEFWCNDKIALNSKNDSHWRQYSLFCMINEHNNNISRC